MEGKDLDRKKYSFNKSAQQNTHFETILDSIADGVFTIDLDFNIRYFNRAAEKITGVSKDQALGQKCFDVFRANICQTGPTYARHPVRWVKPCKQEVRALISLSIS